VEQFPWLGARAGLTAVGRERSAGPHAGLWGTRLPPSVKERMTVRAQVHGPLSQASLVF